MSNQSPSSTTFASRRDFTAAIDRVLDWKTGVESMSKVGAAGLSVGRAAAKRIALGAAVAAATLVGTLGAVDGGESTAAAGGYDCGSDIVPIVHVESVGPVRFDSDPADATEPAGEDLVIGKFAPVQEPELCGWIVECIDQASEVFAIQPLASDESSNLLGSANASADKVAEHQNSVAPSITTMWAGLTAARNWKSVPGPLGQTSRSLVQSSLADLWTMASQSLENWSDEHQLSPTVILPPAPRFAAAEMLVGGSAFIFTLHQEYQSYDLAESDKFRPSLIDSDWGPFDVAKLDVAKLDVAKLDVAKLERVSDEAITFPSPISNLAALKSSDRTPLAIEYRPFELASDLANRVASKIAGTVDMIAASVVAMPVADLVPNGDFGRESDAVLESLAIAQLIEDIELQLAIILDDAAGQMAAQKRADHALAVTMDWVRGGIASWAGDDWNWDSVMSIANRRGPDNRR